MAKAAEQPAKDNVGDTPKGSAAKSQRATEAGGSETKVTTPKSQTQSLAKLIPLKDTIAFNKRISSHHSKSHGDLRSCLKGTSLNKVQKRQSIPQKQGSISHTANSIQQTTTDNLQSEETNKSLNKQKLSNRGIPPADDGKKEKDKEPSSKP